MSEVEGTEELNDENTVKAPAEELVDLILTGELHAANQKYNSIIEDKVLEAIEEEKHKISQTLFAEDDKDDDDDDGDDKVKKDDEEDEDDSPVGKADEGKIPPQFLKKGDDDSDDDDSDDDDSDSDSDDDDDDDEPKKGKVPPQFAKKEEVEPVDEVSRDLALRAAQKASDRHASGVSASLRGDDSARVKRSMAKHGRQDDKFSAYAASKSQGSSIDDPGKEKGVGSRTQDPKHKQELKDKASGKAAKAASDYAKKRTASGESGDYFKDEVSPETSFDPGEASANVELPKDSFVQSVSDHLAGKRI